MYSRPEAAEVLIHYHLTNEYPYSLRCFMGDNIVRARMAHMGKGGQGSKPSPRCGPAGEGDPAGLADATERLGVSEQALKDVLGSPSPDITGEAQKLGISRGALREAMGHPSEDKRPDRRKPPRKR